MATSCNISRKGHCWDNAPAEIFLHTLKTELFHNRRFPARGKAKQEIFEFIEVFYQRQRKHSTLGYGTPAEFEHTPEGLADFVSGELSPNHLPLR